MLEKLKNAVWLVVGGIVGLWALTSIVGIVQGGELDPPAAPGSTMQELDDIPPSWHKFIQTSDRFEDFGQGLGYVLDHETGLVWEASPSTIARTWFATESYCYSKTVGGEVGQRMGWRLPTIEELLTLVEPLQSSPALPLSHPFSNIQSGVNDKYWTITGSDAGGADPVNAYLVGFSTGIVFGSAKEGSSNYAWCVRGGSGYNVDSTY